MKTKKISNADKIAHEEKYMEFLKKRLESKNYRQNSTEEEYKKTLEVKLVLKFLKSKI